MIKRVTTAAILATTLSACVSVEPARDVTIPSTNGKTFTFNKTPAPGINLTKSQVLSGLKWQISEMASHRYGCNPMCKTPKDGRPGYYYRGAIIEQGTNSYTVTYRRGESYLSTGGSMMESHRDITAELPFTVDEQNDAWVVKLSGPTSMHKTRGNDDWFLFKTNEQAIAQYNKLISKLDPEIVHMKSDSGEFRVNYDPASVITSLNRKLRPISSTTQGTGGYSNIYKLQYGDQTAEAEVKVYLSKGKSLIEYTIKQRLVVNAEGGSSFDANALSVYKQQLVAAANS